MGSQEDYSDCAEQIWSENNGAKIKLQKVVDEGLARPKFK